MRFMECLQTHSGIVNKRKQENLSLEQPDRRSPHYDVLTAKVGDGGRGTFFPGLGTCRAGGGRGVILPWEGGVWGRPITSWDSF